MLFDLNNNSVITQLKYPGDTRHHFLIFIGKSLTLREEYLWTEEPGGLHGVAKESDMTERLSTHTYISLV